MQNGLCGMDQLKMKKTRVPKMIFRGGCVLLSEQKVDVSLGSKQDGKCPLLLGIHMYI